MRAGFKMSVPFIFSNAPGGTSIPLAELDANRNEKRKKMEFDCGVYKITDIETGDFYIGSAKKLHIRKTQHFSDLKNGRHANGHLQHIYNKNRKLKFEVYIITSSEDRLFFEQRCIDMLEPKLNKTLNALAPMDGKTHSEEYVGKLRERALSPDSPLKSASAVAARSGDNHYMRRADYDKSKHPSKNPEIVAKRKEKISGDNHYMRSPDYDRNSHMSKKPEVREKLSQKISGKKHPMFGKKNIIGAFSNFIRHIHYWGA